MRQSEYSSIDRLKIHRPFKTAARWLFGPPVACLQILILIACSAIAQDFAVYVSDAGSFSTPPWQILKFDSQGQNPEVFIDDNLNWPQDILFLEDENLVLISNLGSGRITRHDATTGEFISDFADSIGGPTRMKIGPDGLLYVLQWGGNGRVLRYRLDGTFVDEFTSRGVSQSIGLDWDADGNLYVSTYSGRLVRRFDADGEDLGVFISSNLAGPTNIWFDESGDLLVSDYNGTEVKRFDAAGQYVEDFIVGLSQSEGVDFLESGDILIGNGGDSSVKLFASDGTYIRDFVASRSGGLTTPNAVVIRGASTAAPVAAFELAAELLTVSFTDLSTGGPSSWLWDFGDGSTSSEQNPSHTYAAAGTYEVSLTVSNSGGSDSTSMDVTVEEAGMAELDHLYFFPAAARAAGAEGSFFLTDVSVNNSGGSMATFTFMWLPRGIDNSEATRSELFQLGAGVSATYADVLGAAFGLEDGALGALAVASDSADLLLFSRTYNQVAAKQGGTFGQGIVGSAIDELIAAGTRKRIIFFVQNEGFRSNLGLMNGTGSEIRVHWERFIPDGTSMGTGSVDLPPWGNTQVNTVFDADAPVIGGYVDVWTTTDGGAFAAYGSLLDNITSDPTTLPAQ